MTSEDKVLLDRINNYAEKALGDIDPQKTQISYQLDKIKPIMEEIAKEQNVPVEDILIKYLDLASEVAANNQTKFMSTVGNISKYGDVQDLGSL